MKPYFSISVRHLYNKKDERAILYNDADLKIDWQVDNPNISEKDMNAELFKDIERDFEY